jgi:hypothetical protein
LSEFQSLLKNSFLLGPVLLGHIESLFGVLELSLQFMNSLGIQFTLFLLDALQGNAFLVIFLQQLLIFSLEIRIRVVILSQLFRFEVYFIGQLVFLLLEVYLKIGNLGLLLVVLLFQLLNEFVLILDLLLQLGRLLLVLIQEVFLAVLELD